MPAIRFTSKKDAVYYRNRHHPRKHYQVVRSKYFDWDAWKYRFTWVVVYVGGRYLNHENKQGAKNATN